MSKRRTHEEYVIELSVKNPTVEVIGKYVDSKTKITHHCLIHDVYWDVLSSNVLSGKGCKECMKDKNRNKFTKTHDEYILQVKEANSDIEVLEKYINSKTPILHLCKKHNIKWKAIPSNILKGCGCEKCKSDKIIKNNLKSHEQYVEELAIKNPNIKVIGQYIDSHTPILHLCEEHDIYWDASPSNLLQGRGCLKCGIEKNSNARSKLHKDYVSDISIKNPNIEIIEEYINSKTKVMHHCLKHDIYWKAIPVNILKGCGCYKCTKEKLINSNCKSQKQYIKELSLINSNVVVLEEYINMKTPILHKCIIHDIEWKTTPSSVLQGCGCKKCKSDKLIDKRTKTHEQYVEDLKTTNRNIIVIDSYKGANIPILHKCLIDDNEWYTSPTNVLSGETGCPQCSESKGERQVRLWLEEHNISYEKQYKFEDCCDIKPLPFDFYLPAYNKAIEYDGKQHFEPVEYFGGQEGFEIRVKHDIIKNEYCKNNNIPLLRIPYYKNTEEELNNFFIYLI